MQYLDLCTDPWQHASGLGPGWEGGVPPVATDCCVSTKSNAKHMLHSGNLCAGYQLSCFLND